MEENIKIMYFRVTAYHAGRDLSVIIDSHGMHEKLWELSALLVQRGFKVLEASNGDRFLDGNIKRHHIELENIMLRAAAHGKPEAGTYNDGGITYAAVKVDEKIYIPDKDKRV